MPKEPTRLDVVRFVRGFAEYAPSELDALLALFAAGAVREAVPLGAGYRDVREILGFLTE
jgi:hypothetical protein